MNWGDPNTGQSRVSAFAVAALLFALIAAFVSVGLMFTLRLPPWNALFAMAAPLAFVPALVLGAVAAWQCRQLGGSRGLGLALIAEALAYFSLAIWSLLISGLLRGPDGQRLAVELLAVVGVGLIIFNACEAMKYLVVFGIAMTITLSVVSLKVHEARTQSYTTQAKNNLRELGFNMAKFQAAQNRMPSIGFSPPRAR